MNCGSCSQISSSCNCPIKANHRVFEVIVPCVYLFQCLIVTELMILELHNRFRVMHAVDSLKVKHKL